MQPDNFTEVLLYLLNMAAGRAPMIPLDDALRPTWLFGATVHEGCDRGGYYEQAQFAEEYGSPTCIVKLGCWGPVVQCNVGKRGWMSGIGGCPNVGGICIGCTMPGFPDKFMPFMNQPPGSLLSSSAVMTYGRAIHALRRFTQASLNKEPPWRSRGRIECRGQREHQAVESTFLIGKRSAEQEARNGAGFSPARNRTRPDTHGGRDSIPQSVGGGKRATGTRRCFSPATDFARTHFNFAEGARSRLLPKLLR